MRLTIPFLGTLFTVVLAGCAGSSGEADDAPEGASDSFVEDPKKPVLTRHRTIIEDLAVANVLAQKGGRTSLTAAADRSGELSGLLHRAGKLLDNVAYGVVCTPPTRDQVCMVRWVSREATPDEATFGGDLGQAIEKVFGAAFDGDRLLIRCAEGHCTMKRRDGAFSTADVVVDTVTLERSQAKSFAGIE